MTVRVEVTADRRFGTNSYLVEDVQTHDAVVIDANLEPDLVIGLARGRGANVKAILLTHTDLDHIAGLHELLEAFGPLPVAVHDAERHVVSEGKPLRREFGPMATRVDGVTSLEPGQVYRAGSLAFDVLHTPGHSPGGVSLHAPALGTVFSGDTLFNGGPGATGRSFSSRPTLLQSIEEKLFPLPESTVVRTGHGDDTTIGAEKDRWPESGRT